MNSFSSTCKSTSNSHQENIPNSSETVWEELKYELKVLFNMNQNQEQSDKLSKSGMKNPKSKKLDIINKVREPLTVRKFDKNSQALWVKDLSQKNSLYLSSTLPVKCLWFDLLNEEWADESDWKVAEANSSF